MEDGNRPDDGAPPMKPRQQVGEEFGSIKHRQLDDRNAPERADIARGSETETRSAASRRG